MVQRLKGVNLMNNAVSFIGICMAFVVIALGAWTRLVDAGLGCPDWPGCYGLFFGQTMKLKTLAESRFPMFPYDINKATSKFTEFLQHP